MASTAFCVGNHLHMDATEIAGLHFCNCIRHVCRIGSVRKFANRLLAGDGYGKKNNEDRQT